ncbi:tRNA lysidine(34) synthetase TilS [Wenjunlia vitaminophila]|uniref:tRNA lysidine(34) synthetase TilS n=1 Tax=Wenjunlia vitaminophila TaxID=76728 RepID=UPI0003767C62
MGPHPAVAAIRLAVRRVLHDVLRDLEAGRAGVAGPVNGTGRDTDPAPGAARSVFDRPGAHRDGTTRNGAPHVPGARPVEPGSPDRGSAEPVVLDPAAHDPSASDRSPGLLVLAACSGGADSMALASALAFEAPKLGIRPGAVTIDHGLQDGSTTRALEVANRLRDLGLHPVEALAVTVGNQGGPEAAARTARYTALDFAARRHGAVAVLLGHTRDDQAETVLLGLARGSGTRSLSGMPAVNGRYRRPFLHLDRDTTRRACHAQSLTVWEDPHNADPAYTRSRVRHEALPVLEKSLGKGVVEALARTAQLSRDDADALDCWATRAEAEVREDDGGLDAARLLELPPAVRRRVLRRAAVSAGSPAGSLFAQHIEEVDRLVTGWHGQGPLHLPGGVEADRRCGRLFFRRRRVGDTLGGTRKSAGARQPTPDPTL